MGDWDGKIISVKLWNKGSKDGLMQMKNEIEILRMMKSRCEAVFGRAVPEVLLTWLGKEVLNLTSEDDELDHDMIGSGTLLVTEFVGKEIYRDEEGMLFLVEGETEKLIEEQRRRVSSMQL